MKNRFFWVEGRFVEVDPSSLIVTAVLLEAADGGPFRVVVDRACPEVRMRDELPAEQAAGFLADYMALTEKLQKLLPTGVKAKPEAPGEG